MLKANLRPQNPVVSHKKIIKGMLYYQQMLVAVWSILAALTLTWFAATPSMDLSVIAHRPTTENGYKTEQASSAKDVRKPTHIIIILFVHNSSSSFTDS